MSKKTVICWSIWVSLLSALFNWLVGLVPTYKYLANGAGAPWILFVCLAVFFAGGFGKKRYGAGNMQYDGRRVLGTG